MANVPRFQGLQEHGKSLDAGVVYAGQSLHADLTGPMGPVGIGGVKYVFVVADAWTRYVFAFPCKTEKDVPTLLIYLLERIRVHVTSPRGRVIKSLHTDNGSEFTNKKVTHYLQRRTIFHIRSAPGVHGSNGLVERHIRAIFEKVRTMLIPSGLPIFLWPEAVKHAAHLRNIVPHESIERNGKTRILKAVRKKVLNDESPDDSLSLPGTPPPAREPKRPSI